MKTVHIEKSWCKLCALCVKFCPVQNLVLTESGISDIGKCTGCRLCEMHCPDYAIEIR